MSGEGKTTLSFCSWTSFSPMYMSILTLFCLLMIYLCRTALYEGEQKQCVTVDEIDPLRAGASADSESGLVTSSTRNRLSHTYPRPYSSQTEASVFRRNPIPISKILGFRISKQSLVGNRPSFSKACSSVLFRIE